MIGHIFFGLIWTAFIMSFTCYMIEYYAKPETTWSVRIVLFLSWVVGFWITYLLPLDLSGEFNSILPDVWATMYIFVMLSCWVFVPLLQGYYDNGGFTRKDKAIASLKTEGKFYLFVIVVASSFILYMSIKENFSFEQISGVIMALANTWGLSLVTLMLGYGVVEVPRTYYYSAFRGIRQKYLEFRVAMLHEDAQVEQDRMQQTYNFIQLLDKKIPDESSIRLLFETVKMNCLHPTAYKFANIAPSAPVETHGGLKSLKKVAPENLTYAHMIKLHHVTILHKRALRLTKAEWSDAVNEYFWNERINALIEQYPTPQSLPDSALIPASPTTYSPFPGSWVFPLLFGMPNTSSPGLSDYTSSNDDVEGGTTLDDLKTTGQSSANYNYNNDDDNSSDSPTIRSPGALSISQPSAKSCFPSQGQTYKYPLTPGTRFTQLSVMWFKYTLYYDGTVRKYSSFLMMALSALIVWCEFSIMLESDLSPLSRLLKAVGSSAFASMFFSMLPLLYITACTFYTLFRVKFSSFYHMHSHGRTGETSILHNAAFMLRLVLPIAYNFFRMIRAPHTAFEQVNGNMEAVPFLGGSFNQYMPVIIVAISCITLFNCFGHFFKYIGIPRFDNSSSETASDSSHVKEGKILIERERKFRINGRIYDEDVGRTSAVKTGQAIYKPSASVKDTIQATTNAGIRDKSLQHKYHSQRENTMSLEDF